MDKAALIKAISSTNLPYIKNQTLAGVTLNRISKGLIGTPEQVRSHIEAFNNLEPKLDISLESDITYLEKSEIDKVVGREEELLELLMDKFKGTLVINSTNADGIMRIATVAETENVKALLNRLEKLQRTEEVEEVNGIKRIHEKERAYFHIMRKRENNYCEILRKYSREIKEKFIFDCPQEDYGDNILVASVYALRSTIRTIDSYRELDLLVRLAYYYYLLSLLGDTFNYNIQFNYDYELEKIYQQFMKDEFPHWSEIITEMWSDALEAKYHRSRDILIHDLELSLRFMTYNFMQINPISVDKYTETLRRVHAKALKAYFIREKNDTGYFIYLDALEYQNGNLNSLMPRIGHIELFYNKGVEDGLRVTVTYEKPDALGEYQSFYIDHDKSGSILEYDRSDKIQTTGIISEEGEFSSIEITFTLIKDGSTDIDPALVEEGSLGYITAHISNPKSSVGKEDDMQDEIITYAKAWKYLTTNNYLGDYVIR